MFEAELKEKLHRIFGMRKTTYDVPSESFEQDTLFIQVDQSINRPSEGMIFSKVVGELIVFSKTGAMPFGYMSKAIEKAKLEDKKNLFFYEVDRNIESSPARMIDLVERRTSFQFLYKGQYDPRQGSLTELELKGE